VSLSTVSLVLNNNPRISASTREKVLAAVEKHQYQPNAFARSLASRSSRALSVVVPHLNHVFADVYFGEIVSGIYEHATDLGYEAAQWLMERFPKVTAVMAGNDKMAIGAIRYILSKGLRIPQDVSVMGVDDIPGAQFTTPQLTTVRHDLYRIGRLAVDGLLAL